MVSGMVTGLRRVSEEAAVGWSDHDPHPRVASIRVGKVCLAPLCMSAVGKVASIPRKGNDRVEDGAPDARMINVIVLIDRPGNGLACSESV